MPKLKQTGETFIDENDKKQITRKKTHNKWFETQDSISYWNEFLQQKIVYPNMTKFLPFVFDNTQIVTNQKCFIITGDNLKYLTGFLNSKVFKSMFKDYFPELQGGTRELSKVFFEKLLIPKISKTAQKPFIKLTNKIIAAKEQGTSTDDLEKESNKLVYNLYQLTLQEIDLVENFY